MTNQINQSSEENIQSSDDELNQNSFCWDIKQYRKNINIMYGDNDEDDWFIQSDDDNGDNEITHHHYESQNLKDLDWWEVPYYIKGMDQISTNRYERQKASHEKHDLLSIRHHLATNNLFLLPAYKGTGYHVYSAGDFQPKVSEFMARTDVYSFICKLSRSHPYTSQECLVNIVNCIETTLNNLLHSQCITEAQYTEMNINRSMVRMHYLYFVADTNKVCLLLSLSYYYYYYDYYH